MKWSQQQSSVIQSDNHNALVSASAGSGKTAVMVERLGRILRDKNIDIRRTMLVTFTLEVAAELKSKIAKMLKESLQSGEGDAAFLRQQLDYLPMCEISTLHSMCSNLIKTNFHFVGIDPSFTILEEDNANIMFAQAVGDVLKEYEISLNPLLFTLERFFGSKKALEQAIKKYYSFVVAQKDRDEFLKSKAYAMFDVDLDSNILIVEYIEQLNDNINVALAKLREFEVSCKSNNMKKHVDFICSIQSYFRGYEYIRTFKEMLQFFKRGFDAGRLPSKSSYKDDVEKSIADDFKAFYKQFKDEFDMWRDIATHDYKYYEQQNISQRKYVEFLSQTLEKVIDNYSRLKLSENKLDFNDLEYYAVKLLENDEMANAVKNNYDYICVDEYQDINDVQEYILSRISNGTNLFMVGDSKQSIYRFRMTDPTIFINKFDKYRNSNSDGKAYVLNANYRSCNEVLNFVNRIFDVIMTKNFGGVNYKQDSRLEFGGGYTSCTDKPIRVVRFDKETQEIEFDLPKDNIYSVMQDSVSTPKNELSEALYIAEQISLLVGRQEICELDNDQNQTFRKIKYSDIALLSLNRSPRAAVILQYLRGLHIPIAMSNLTKKTRNYAIDLLLDFLALVCNPMQDYSLISVLISPIGGFSLSQLAYIKNLVECEFFYQAFEFASNNPNQLYEQCKCFKQLLDDYKFRASYQRVSDLVMSIIYQSGYDGYLLSKEDGEQMLGQLLNFVQNLKTKNYDFSLSAMLAAVSLSQDSSLSSATEQGEEDCVKTNTIHASKGLEYPIVFLIDSGSEFVRETTSKIIFDSDSGVLMRNINEEKGVYSSGLLWNILIQKKHRGDLEEKMRLLYVALTRAKNMLYVTATKKKSKTDSIKSVDKCNSLFDWIYTVCLLDEGFRQDYYSEESYQQVDFEVKTSPQITIQSPLPQIMKQVEQFENIDYKYSLATKLGIKHTVTEINNSVTSDMIATEFVHNSAISYAKHVGTDFVGTAYHKVLELIDLSLRHVSDIQKAIEKMVDDKDLTVEQADAIDVNIIAQILSCPIFDLNKQQKCWREKEFMLYIPANKILDTPLTDKVLLQGTIDMLILGELNILVDFKLSEHTPKFVQQKYAKQIQLYQLAAETCLNIKLDHKYIYLIGQNQLIQM